MDLLSIGIKLALKDGLEQKASQDDSRVKNTPRSSLDDKYVPCLQSFSFHIEITFQANATRCTDQLGDVDELSPTFFDGMEAEVDSSPMDGACPHSSVNALFARLSSLLLRFRPQSSEANELLQTSRPSAFCPHALLARLSSLLHRFCSETDAPDELQQSSIPSRLAPAMRDREVLFVAEPLRSNCTHSLIAPQYQVQDLRICYPSECWLIPYFLSAAHPLSPLAAMHTQHNSGKAKRRLMPHHRKRSTSKVNHTVNRRLNLLLPPCAATPPPSIADTLRSFSAMNLFRMPVRQ
ncbi:uncharacterized protein F5891DRAFT_1213936 [Suillus fuscotomentosus]|uniref:Uncharacterized protein n=1 Tax=Suillus fuscotomentosus TaxID=1912939 RepID=A0AAD4HDF0_9AGAM|nr:uncharacterized protein F5891DRAFT_1213936 [Suillus fuscotomentosus]KAG1889776.1 hypothetical protein F5891DRAFT_1213936 [Suillus fuscotomentosus]